MTDTEGELHFFVNGQPIPQGSKRIGRNRATGQPILLDDNDKPLKAWRHNVTTTAAAAARRANLQTAQGPCTVALEFVFARPAGHYGTGRNAHTLKASAPPYPAVKPDVDKLTRAVLDALTTAAVWFDDSRVVRVTASKIYGPTPGCRIFVCQLDPRKAAA